MANPIPSRYVTGMRSLQEQENALEPAADAVVTLCTQCAPAAFPDNIRTLRDALDAAGLAIAVRGQGCLNCCEAPQAMALQGAGRAVYVFHGLNVAEDLPDILATVTTWLRAEHGWIEDAQACGRLRFCLRARILPA